MAKEVSNKKKKEVSKDNKTYIKDFKAELKKVSWPSFKQLVNNTTAVIVIVLITAAIVFVLDLFFKTLNKYGVESIKAIVTSNSSEENVVEDENQAEVTADENATAENTTDEENIEETNTVIEEATTENTATTDAENTVEQ